MGEDTLTTGVLLTADGRLAGPEDGDNAELFEELLEDAPARFGAFPPDSDSESES